MDNSSGYDELVLELVRQTAQGRLQARDVLPALQDLAGLEGAAGLSRLELLQQLASIDLPGVSALRRSVLAQLMRLAGTFHHRCRTGDAPDAALVAELRGLPLDARIGWRNDTEHLRRMRGVLQLVRDRNFLRTRTNVSTTVRVRIDKALADAREFMARHPETSHLLRPDLEVVADPLASTRELELQRAVKEIATALDTLPAPLPPDLDEELLLAETTRRFLARETAGPKRVELLDALLRWPGCRAASVIASLPLRDEDRDRAMLVLTLRFGEWTLEDWEGWRAWLETAAQQAAGPLAELAALRQTFEPEARLLWYRNTPRPDQKLLEELDAQAVEAAAVMPVEEFVGRWSDALTPRERSLLVGAGVSEVPTAQVHEELASAPPAVPVAAEALAPAPPAPPVAPPPAVTARVEEPVPGEPEFAEAAPLSPAEPGPSFWRDHVQPFVSSNWYIVAGGAMVVVGASLLAYFTWDKHWLVRYTVMPGMLALLTMAFARMARWIEGKDAAFRGTGAMLRAVALALLPANFMAVGLLSRDPDVAPKVLFVPLMAAVYLAVFAPLLYRWCRDVHPRLALTLGLPLLLLNALAGLWPLADLYALRDIESAGIVLVAGFYGGFLVVLWAVRKFVREILEASMVQERIVPWFFGGIVAVTFLQVFAWVYKSAEAVPSAIHYSLLVVLSGGMVLAIERRLGQLRAPAPPRRAGESFIGYALVLLGVLMAMPSPGMRIAALALAGLVWLYQAPGRPDPSHYWMGLTFLMVAGGAVGLLPSFPRSAELNGLPFLGILVALGFALPRVIGRKIGQAGLTDAATEMQPVAILLTAVVTVLSQWRFRSVPWHAGVVLVAASAIMAVRAHRAQRLGWVLSTVALLALSLPYLGCVDMLGLRFYGNTLVFGLAVLSAAWVALIRLRPTPLLLQARSTALWLLGAVAVVAMMLRVLVERGQPGDVLWYRGTMDYAGPFLMAAVMIVTAWHSRSLIPSAMAAFITVILYPELKTRLQELYPILEFRSGLASAITAIVLTLLCFMIRRVKALERLPEGDLFLGRFAFPLRRYDATLFTIPLTLTALFLAARVNTWTLHQNMTAAHGVGWRTVWALGLNAVTWTCLAALLRPERAARILVPFGWIAAFLAFYFGNRLVSPDQQIQYPILFTCLTIHAAGRIYWLMRPGKLWIEEWLMAPGRVALRWGSLALAAWMILYLWGGGGLERIAWLCAFVAAQQVLDAAMTGRVVHGWALFLLLITVLTVQHCPGRGLLAERFSPSSVMVPYLVLALVVQVGWLVVELLDTAWQRLCGIVVPFHVGSIALALMLLSFVVFSVTGELSMPAVEMIQQAGIIAVLALAARANHSGGLALLAVLGGYLLVHYREVLRCPALEDDLRLLLTPWHTAVLGLAMALAAPAGRCLTRQFPFLMQGRRPLLSVVPEAAAWMFLPAILLACESTLMQMATEWRHERVQLWAPYVGTLTMIVVGRAWGRPRLLMVGGVLLTIANVQFVNVFFGAPLRRWMLGDAHVVCIGLLATMVQASLIRVVLRDARAKLEVHCGNLLLGAAILVLLALNYVAQSDLARIPATRFLVSGLLALAAGGYFRQPARHPVDDERPYGEWFEALYHFGLTVSLWCFALMIPILRTPATALFTLGIPAVYFYGRTEYLSSLGDDASRALARRYRHSAAMLGFILLGLYVFRPVFQMILFSSVPIDTAHYHVNSPMVLLLSFMLFRLHGLGGNWWLAFYGGLAMVTGTYFLVTWYPGLSPFVAPIPAAWAGVIVAHFYIVTNREQSGLRSMVQDFIGRISAPDWHLLRLWWARCLFVATHVLIVSGLTEYRADSYAVAPLLAGAASIGLHIVLSGGSAFYAVVAGLEVVGALHADFFVRSYLPRDVVVWVVLAVWLAVSLAWPLWEARTGRGAAGVCAALFAVLAGVHVLYHRPDSAVGLGAVTLMGLVAALTPRASARCETGEQEFSAGLLLVVFPWLAYFGLAGGWGRRTPDWLATRAVLGAAAAVLATAWVVRAVRVRGIATRVTAGVVRPLLFHQVLSLIQTRGAVFVPALLCLVFGVGGAVLVTHYGQAYSSGGFTLLFLIWAASAVLWFREAVERRQMVPHLLAQLCVLGLAATVRRQLMLTTDFWNYEFDVWTSLVVSFALAGSRPVIHRRYPEIRLPMMGALLAMPVIALIWTQVRGLGTDITLVVIGLHSLLFAFIGKDERESPFNLLAVGGFVAFVVTLFWSKLQLRVLHAYTIPVGIGVLALLQIFGREMSRDTRERVRLATLAVMLGTSGYYALADSRYPVAFNLTMLVLCLVAMVFGSFFRVRVYLFMGMAGLLATLGSIVYKVVSRLDRTYQMTTVGVLLLLLGGVVVWGSVYYKTHQAQIDNWLERVRGQLREWR